MSEDKREALKKRVEAITELKTLSNIIRDIMRVSADENSTVEDFENVVSTDFAIATKLLAIANSAFYGFPRQIKTINQAIIVLGFEMTKGLAIATAVFNDLPGPNRRQVMNFWKHSFHTAAVASLIAGKTELVNKSTAFLAGLLHDIGRPIFYALYEEKYLESALYTKGTLIDTETHGYGAGHHDVGAWFADKCKLPEEIIEAIRLHHSPEATHSRLVATVYAADIVVSTGTGASLSDSVISPMHFAVLGRIGLTGESLDAISEEYETMRDEMETFCR